jgi:hypothetical protein
MNQPLPWLPLKDRIEDDDDHEDDQEIAAFFSPLVLVLLLDFFAISRPRTRTTTSTIRKFRPFRPQDRRLVATPIRPYAETPIRSLPWGQVRYWAWVSLKD